MVSVLQIPRIYILTLPQEEDIAGLITLLTTQHQEGKRCHVFTAGDEAARVGTRFASSLGCKQNRWRILDKMEEAEAATIVNLKALEGNLQMALLVVNNNELRKSMVLELYNAVNRGIPSWQDYNNPNRPMVMISKGKTGVTLF